jgi:hypothetical protein
MSDSAADAAAPEPPMKLSSLLAAGALALAGAVAPLAAQTAAKSGIEVRQPWTRATTAGQSVGAGYLTLRNAGPRPDRLLGASSPAAERVELHSMAMEGDVMRMRAVDSLELPAGGSFELKPGGLHLMLLGLKRPLQPGQPVPLTLRFEKAGEVAVEVSVDAPAAPVQHGKH